MATVLTLTVSSEPETVHQGSIYTQYRLRIAVAGGGVLYKHFAPVGSEDSDNKIRAEFPDLPEGQYTRDAALVNADETKKGPALEPIPFTIPLPEDAELKLPDLLDIEVI